MLDPLLPPSNPTSKLLMIKKNFNVGFGGGARQGGGGRPSG
jgi:hypothetical protein